MRPALRIGLLSSVLLLTGCVATMHTSPQSGGYKRPPFITQPETRDQPTIKLGWFGTGALLLVLGIGGVVAWRWD